MEKQSFFIISNIWLDLINTYMCVILKAFLEHILKLWVVTDIWEKYGL